MLVDPKLSKTANKQQIIAAARVARAQILAATAANTPNSVNKVGCMPRSKSSLPDLAFLKDYADDRPKMSSQQQQQFVSQPLSSTATNNGDILKRKTLKSIKRYRQTKQNTEPCAPVVSNPAAGFSIFGQSQQNQSGGKLHSPQAPQMSILHDYSQQKQKFMQQQQRQYFIEQQLQQQNLKEEEEEEEEVYMEETRFSKDVNFLFKLNSSRIPH